MVGVYKSPNTREDNKEALFKEMRRLSDTSSHLLVTGDFNYKGIDWVTWNVRPGTDETKCINFLECVRDSYLHQHVTLPTRARINQEPSILDLIFTNEENMIKDLQILSPLGKSDHACLTFNYICNRSKISKPWTKYFYDKGNYKIIKEELEATNWDELFKKHMDQPGVVYELLNKRILEL